jgi:sec-independent protein translocase protein TatA
MNLGPAEILVILVVALIVFGPKRLPEVGRQVGTAMRELRRMQDSLKSELDEVLHPDVPHDAVSETDHAALPAPTVDESSVDAPDDGFASPGSFS